MRVAVGLLARRVDTLAQYIEGSGLPVPKIEENDYLVLKSIFEALELACNDLDANPGRTGEAQMLVDGGIDSIEGMEAISSIPKGHLLQPQRADRERPASKNDGSVSSTTEGKTQDVSLQEPTSARVDKQATPGQGLRDADIQDHEGDWDAESDDEVTDQLSCRLGRLQLTHDGQLRYFGSTSNMTLLDALVDVTPPIAVQKDASELLEHAQLDKELDETFETHLLELYFAWQDPCLHVVDAETFWRSRAQSRYEGIATPYYSRTLSDAMCALGAAYEPRYHPEVVTFPRSLAEFFGDRAKILLELELETPSIATIQGLVILSNHEALCTRDTRGWLYSGKYLKLIFKHHADMERNGNAINAGSGAAS